MLHLQTTHHSFIQSRVWIEHEVLVGPGGRGLVAQHEVGVVLVGVGGQDVGALPDPCRLAREADHRCDPAMQSLMVSPWVVGGGEHTMWLTDITGGEGFLLSKNQTFLKTSQSLLPPPPLGRDGKARRGWSDHPQK